MRFKEGQEVVCVRRTAPYDIVAGPGTGEKISFGPKFNEPVTVARYDGDWYIVLYEYEFSPDGKIMSFHESYFEPLVSDEVLRAELEEVPEPFTI